MTSITLNEIFLGSLLLSVYFSTLLFKSLDLVTVGDVGGLISVILFIVLLFYTPLYSSIKVIFSRDKSKYDLRFKFFGLSIWGTIWIMTLLFIGSVTIFDNLFIFDRDVFIFTFSEFRLTDYILVFYLSIYLVRILLLLFFSHYLKIERFGVIHLPINQVFLVAVSLYSLYLLWGQPFQIGDLPISGLFYLFQSVVSVYATGSILLQIYYMFSRKEAMS